MGHRIVIFVLFKGDLHSPFILSSLWEIAHALSCIQSSVQWTIMLVRVLQGSHFWNQFLAVQGSRVPAVHYKHLLNHIALFYEPRTFQMHFTLNKIKILIVSQTMEFSFLRGLRRLNEFKSTFESTKPLIWQSMFAIELTTT